MRIKARSTVNRELRRGLNTHASALAVEGKALSEGGKEWLQSLVSADYSLEEMAAFKVYWNRLKAENSDQVAGEGKQ